MNQPTKLDQLKNDQLYTVAILGEIREFKAMFKTKMTISQWIHRGQIESVLISGKRAIKGLAFKAKMTNFTPAEILELESQDK